MRKISRRSFLAGAALCGAAAALTACGGSSASSTAASSVAASSAAAGSAAAAGDSYTVGICQLVEHAALDAATQGFEDALSAEFGENVTFDFQNAQNDSATCATIANGFVSAGVDLIMANATPALQAAQAATNEIPILGTSVTEYGVALGLTDFTGTVGGNVSGTSDLAPLDQQAEMITEWLPEATKVGLLYCSAEANSQYQVDEVKKYLEDKGITATQYSFSDSNDLASVCQKAADENDAVYVPTDNTVAANTGIVDGICRPAKKPVFAGEEGICAGCGVAAAAHKGIVTCKVINIIRNARHRRGKSAQNAPYGRHGNTTDFTVYALDGTHDEAQSTETQKNIAITRKRYTFATFEPPSKRRG